MSVALIRNAAGNFIAPSIESITAAAAGVADTLPAATDYRISIANAPGPNAYPISSFSWILIYQKPTDAAKGQKLVDFLKWAVTEGQQYAGDLHYAPLPQKIVDGVQQKLGTVQLAPK
jgi:phosphate transport system substrate-binding protein